MKLLKYYRVYLQILRNSLAQGLAYRLDFFLRLIFGLMWSFATIGTLVIIFTHSSTINGWTKTELYLVLLAFNLGVYISDALGRRIQYLEEYIRKGKLDPHLSKPIDSQFFMVLGEPEIAGLLFAVGYAAPLVWLLTKDSSGIIWSSIPLFAFFIILANIIWLAIKTIAMTINFWRQRLDNMSFFFFIAAEMGRYPLSVFPKPIQYVFYSVFPIAFLGIIPAQSLLPGFSWWWVVFAAGITLAFIGISRLLWQKAIQNYSSASN